MSRGVTSETAKSHDVTKQKLEDMGISRNQSSKWQKIASITENLINTNQRYYYGKNSNDRIPGTQATI